MKGGLKLSDITGFKLVGVALSRRKKVFVYFEFFFFLFLSCFFSFLFSFPTQHPIPPVILSCSTFWDFQNGKVHAPEYKGFFFSFLFFPF